MRVVIQRVKSASVTVEKKLLSSIGKGFLVFLGIEEADNSEDIEWLTTKIVNLRVFSDEEGKMNNSILNTNGEILLVSQFTLFAATKKGNRPSFIRSARPDIAIPLYNECIRILTEKLGKPVKSGEFGADMDVELINDGPVTIQIDTKNKE